MNQADVAAAADLIALIKKIDDFLAIGRGESINVAIYEGLQVGTYFTVKTSIVSEVLLATKADAQAQLAALGVEV